MSSVMRAQNFVPFSSQMQGACGLRRFCDSSCMMIFSTSSTDNSSYSLRTPLQFRCRCTDIFVLMPKSFKHRLQVRLAGVNADAAGDAGDCSFILVFVRVELTLALCWYPLRPPARSGKRPARTRAVHKNANISLTVGRLGSKPKPACSPFRWLQTGIVY